MQNLLMGNHVDPYSQKKSAIYLKVVSQHAHTDQELSGQCAAEFYVSLGDKVTPCSVYQLWC